MTIFFNDDDRLFLSFSDWDLNRINYDFYFILEKGILIFRSYFITFGQGA